MYYRGLRLWFGGKHLAVASTNLKLPNYYINRELSQLEFCRRVLFMARDGGLPMLERLRYLWITSGILDEFFEIRVSGLLYSEKRGPRRIKTCVYACADGSNYLDPLPGIYSQKCPTTHVKVIDLGRLTCED